MTDLRHLHDAFEELERRADAAGALSTAPKPRRATGFRLVPVAATVVAVAGLAAGAVWLSPGNDAPSGTRAATQPTTTAPPPEHHVVPTTPDELAERFRHVLGDTATFDVTETAGGPVQMTLPPPPSTGTGTPPLVDGSTPAAPTSVKADEGNVLPGAFIKGSLTASGVKGGYDLQIYAGSPGDFVFCDDPDQSSCTPTTLPDGSKLAMGQTELEGGGVTYMANLVRPDGSVLLMHLSNRADPKGAGDVLAPQPPFTVDQLKALVASALWW